MAISGGGDPELRVQITADASAAAAEVGDDFEDAMAKAFKDPRVRAAVQVLAREVGKAFQSLGRNNKKIFDELTRSATRSASQISKAFAQVGAQMQKSMQFNTGPGSQNVAALSQHVIGLTNNFEELSRQSKEALRGIEEIGRSLRQDVRARAQAERDATTAAEAAVRERNAIRQAEQNARLAAARVEVAQIRSTSQLTAASMRRNLAIIQNVWRSATQIVQGFARAASSALRGIGRIVETAFRNVGQIIARAFQAGTRATQAFVRTFGSAFRGIGRGVQSAMARVSQIIRSALSRDEAAVRASVGRQNAARQRLTTARQGGLLGGIGAGGLAGGVGIGAFLTSGFQRAGQEESLQLQFATLLQDGDKAAQVLQRISDYARTTRFDFVEVAGSVAQLTAAFGDVDRAEETVRNLADIVSLTGGGTQQFSAARLAFSQIAASGRLEGQELNQLLESIPGVPIVSILADKFFGGDQAAFQQARRDGLLGGKISADAFFDALEEGVAQRFPEVEGFAERVGTTLTGLADNLKENFAIFGAQIIGLVEGPLKTGMSAINTFLRGVGGFISGDIFEPGAGEGGVGTATNPFAAGALMPGALIPFEELPQEMQDILAERNGWGPNEGFVLAASHASQLWEELHPPKDLNKSYETLRKIRDIIGRMAKSVGVVLGLAAAFKVLQLAIIGLTSPLSLLVLTTAGISGAFSLFYENSEKFRASWDGMWAAIAPTGEAIGGLIRSIRDAFSGAGGGDGPSILQRLGEAFDFIPGAARRALEGIQAFANTLSLLVSGQGFTDFAASLDQAFTAGLGALLGDSPEAEAQRQRAADRGGSNTLNLLEETFLGPVVRFFRGPFADVIERIGGGFADFGGFLGDIFTAIFGDGPGGVGTRVLDVLEGTFLGPVISFFRDLDFGQLLTNVQNFFAPAVELIGSVISGVWDVLEPIAQPVIDKIGEIIDAFKNFDFSDFDLGNIAAGAGVGAAIGGIFAGIPGLLIGAVAGGLSQTGLFGAVVESINNAWEGEIKPALLNLWAKMLGFFADTFKPENLAAYAGFILEFLRDAGRLVANIATDPAFVAAIAGVVAAAGLIVTFFTLGLVEGLIDAVFQWTELISTALESAWDAITPDFSTVPLIGPFVQVIGDLLGSDVGGAVTLIGGAVLGKTIVTSVIAGITGLGPGLIAGAGGLAGMIFGVGGKSGKPGGPFDQDAKTRPFQTLGAKIAGSLAAGFLTYKFSEAAGASGSDGALLLSLLTGTATGAALGFSIAGPLGAAIGALAGTVVAGLGAAFGSAGQRAKEFNDEVARLAQLLSEVPVGQFGALDEAGSIRVISADIVAQFQEGAAAAGADWAPTFIENFDSDAIAADITDGIGSADSAITDVLNNLGDEVASATDVSADEWAGMVDDFLAEADRLGLGVGEALAVIDLPPGMEEALSAAGLSVEGLIAAWEILDPAIRAAGDAFDQANIQGQLEELDPSAIDSITEAVDGLEGILDDVDLGTGEQLAAIQELLAGADLTVDEKFDALADAADNATRALDEAKSALQDFFAEQIAPENVEDVLRGFRLDLPDIGEQVRRELTPEEGIVIPTDVQIDIKAEAVADFRQQVIDGLGTVDNAQEFDQFVDGLTSAINTAVERGELDPDLGGKFLEVVQAVDEAGLSEAGQSLFDAILAAEVDQATVDTATQSLADAIGLSAESQAEGLRGVGRTFDTEIAAGITENAPVVTEAVAQVLGFGGNINAGGSVPTRGRGPGYEAGAKITEDISLAIGDGEDAVRSAATDVGEKAGEGLGEGGASAVAAARIIAVGVAIQFVSLSGTMFSLGANAGNALARGLISQVRAAASAAAAVAIAVVSAARNALAISSPSKVFVDIGKQVGRGFIQGIKDSEGDMAEAIGSGIENAVKVGTTRAAQAIERAGAAGEIFKLLQPSLLPGGVTRTDERLARLDLTQALGGFRTNQREALAGAFGATPAAAQIGDAIRAMQGITTNLNSHFVDLAASIKEAQKTPAAERTLEQRRLLLSSRGSLDARNIIGQGNVEAITQAIETIRSYGETAISQGRPLNEVVANMIRYRGSIEAQARAAGISTASLNALFQQFGVTNAQLRSLGATVTSLNQGTAQGAANVQNFLDVAAQIRDLGSTLIEAGNNTSTVVAQLRTYRDNLINSAVAMGFNRAELNKLIDEIGLSNTGLANFVNQLKAFDAEARKAAETAKKAASDAAKREAEEARKEAEEAAKRDEVLDRQGGTPIPRVGELHVHIPSGDPEAVALVTANRLAYDGISSW